MSAFNALKEAVCMVKFTTLIEDTGRMHIFLIIININKNNSNDDEDDKYFTKKHVS